MRINNFNAYLHDMKARLNLTIDSNLLETIKAYAASKQTSISELVESYFKNISRPAKRKSILDLVEKLPDPKMKFQGDLKVQYFESKYS